MTRATWVLESDVFPDSHSPLRAAVRDGGHRLVDWSDAWWSDGLPLDLGGAHTFFHGSLGNAARIHDESDWSPGSFCNTASFCCSAWYESTRDWLLHADWRLMPANDFVASAADVAAAIGCTDRIFVRPDSPLKPFSGRVLDVSAVTLKALDHGFYFEDESLPIIAAPIRNVGSEWRFVVVRKSVVAGSTYDAPTRSAVPDEPQSEAWTFAQVVANATPSPADAYILDVCECDGELRLLELNPFGGADLYACDAANIVRAVTEVL